MALLLVLGPGPALLHVHGRRRRPLLRRGPPRQGRLAETDRPPRALALVHPRPPRRLLLVQRREADRLDLRQRPQPDRPGLHLPDPPQKPQPQTTTHHP